MEDLFDYLRWRGDLSFTQVPPGPVDALIFSALSYISFGGSVETNPAEPVSLRDAALDFMQLADIQSRCRIKTDLTLLMAAGETLRFGQAKLVRYRSILIPEEDTQFAAITYLLDDGSVFITYRGTDYSLTGWKEDFNMSFQESVPAQRLAVVYAEEIAAAYPGKLYLGGHSKGGNLAVFAAVKSSGEVRSRIVSVFNQDGPGFTDYVMKDPVYLRLVPLIRTYVPQSSVIGMLLEHEEPYTVIKSKQIGLLQHDPYSWVLQGPAFVPVAEISSESRFLDLTIKNWVSEMTIQERNEIVDAVFDFLTVEDVDDVFDLIQLKNLRSYFRTFTTDSNLRRRFAEEIQSLISAARKTQLLLEQRASKAGDSGKGSYTE